MLSGFFRLALGDRHSMILKQDGSVWSTAITVDGLAAQHEGSNIFAQVIPRDAIAVAAGNSYSMVLKGGGEIWVSRENAQGRVDDLQGGIAITESMFNFVQTIAGAEAIAAGSLALTVTEFLILIFDLCF